MMTHYAYLVALFPASLDSSEADLCGYASMALNLISSFRAARSVNQVWRALALRSAINVAFMQKNQ